MLTFMSWIQFFLFLNLLKINCSFVKLFNTENALAVQSYDCVYYTNLTAGNNQSTPYCIRTAESISLDRSFSMNTCGNSGKEWTFRTLKESNVSQVEVLGWSSSIEMVDRYAVYLTTGSEQYANDKICQCSLDTFGKFCEYEFMTEHTFDQTIQYQFYLKKKYRIGSQLWGNITCYTALTDCYFGLRCLAWQNICDRKQQCMYGIDEDHCEELEYNECEDNEYRCNDGSCIAEEYWLDGEYDCSDKSDERDNIGKIEKRQTCSLVSSQFDCDETTATSHYFACGDGEFTTEALSSQDKCYNYRMVMFFCELDWKSYKMHPGWTLADGHCADKGWIEKNLTDLSDSEKCVLYLKCKLTDGASDICNDVVDDFESLCANRTIIYPTEPALHPYIKTVYQLSSSRSTTQPNYVLFDGSIKCIGHQAPIELHSFSIKWSEFEMYYPNDILFCKKLVEMNILNSKIDEPCWRNKNQSFLCQRSWQCISKYRLRNGMSDCHHAEDESEDQKCYMRKQQRLKCSEDLSLCLSVSSIGNFIIDCDEGNDEYIAKFKWNLLDYQCRKRSSIECQVLKSYIQSPTLLSTIVNDQVPIFRQYCDSLMHLPNGYDESRCSEWICPRDQFQCLSGHCIPVKHVTNPHDFEWHCPDASDHVGLFRWTNISDHNARLVTYADLEEKMRYLNETLVRTYFEPFPTFCDLTKEYGCILAGMDQSLNFSANRPCIKLTQIGDGTVDCYGGLDERNLLTCGKNVYQQRGFDFHCSNEECIPYHRLCIDRCSNNADHLLCVQLKHFFNPSCKNHAHIDICARGDYEECYSIGIGNYYCDSQRSLITRGLSVPYRLAAWKQRKTLVCLREYPLFKDTRASEQLTIQRRLAVRDFVDISNTKENTGREGWICGRGVAIQRTHSNQIQCFCPPSLYGQYCQYYSDRIAIITSLDNIPSELLEQEENVIKIVALLLSNDDIVDHHVFHLPLILSKELNKKFRFNLIYPRPKILSNSYRVRFEAYNLIFHSSIVFLGVWEYSIRFPFLPSYRLAQVLKFDQNITFISTKHNCKAANPCLHGSTCHAIINQLNNISAYYCHCNNQSFGKHCERILQPIFSLSCSKYALLRTISSSKSICLCPSHLYGPTCHLNHTCVYRNPCTNGQGKCYPNPDNITRDYICVCDKEFFGDHCELNSAMVQINFTDFLFVQIPSNFILSTVIQLCDFHDKTLDLIIREKRVYPGLPSLITKIYHNDHYLPTMAIMKLYHKFDPSNDYIADLKHPDHFALYVISSNVSLLNLTLMINRTNLCPYTSTIFERNLSNFSHLSEFIIPSQINSSTIIFKYHLFCNEPYSLMCFHDDHYYCLCDLYDHAECFRYNSTLDQCHGRCRTDGQCVRGDLEDRKDFLCLCPRCYYGSICQHNTELFSFTLETLLTNDLYSPSIVIQRLFFSLLAIIPALLFLIGGVNNICCYVTFNRPKPLLVGAGHYLRTASVINQLTLLVLLLKLLHLVLSIKSYIIHQLLNTILCKVLSYLLVCTSRISYWLMGMVAVERVYVTWHLKGTWLKSPRMAKCLIATIIMGVIICDTHELIYYQSIEDPKFLDMNNSTWCVTSYPSAIATYNKMNIILNYILPFLINLLSTIILTVLIIRKRTKAMKGNHEKTSTKDNQSIFRIYLDLLNKYKELILPPSITMLPQLFFLPQFILSFSLACQEFQINWQRYLLIISFFLTYLPQVVSYKLYISPSSFYTEEFHGTKLYKKFSQWRASLHQNQR